MAHSSSGDSCNSAPEVIDAYSPEERVREPKFLCPLCLRSGIFFYCEKCIRNGSFTHSADKRFERFADKKLKLYRLTERKEKLLKRYQELLSARTEAENVKLAILSRQQTNRYLKAYIKKANDRLQYTLQLVERLKQENELFITERSKREEKLSLMTRTVDTSRTKIKEDRLKLLDIEASMKHVRKESIQQLVIYIFPISKVKATNNSSKEYLDPDEPMEAVMVTGHWVLTDIPSDCDFQYKIIESYVPANGNYSAYVDWSSKNQEEILSTEEEEVDTSLKETAYNILTALSFTAHLLTVLCFYLDAHVPKRITPNEFTCRELSRQLFLHKVAKLNTNVVYLCLLQNVDPAHIRPHHTIENLLLLLDPSVSDLGRSGPMEVNQQLPPAIENGFDSELLSIDDEEDSSGNFDELSSDWVKIKVGESDDDDRMIMCEYGAMADQPQYGSQRGSLTGELMSSVASFWKAATWQK